MNLHEKEHYPHYEKMGEMLGFGPQDHQRLRSLGPLIAAHGDSLTDSFYAVLTAESQTRTIIGDRLEQLKRTHRLWLGQLCSGEYGVSFFKTQFHIGTVHVEQGIPPRFVSVVMNIIRVEGRQLIAAHHPPELAGDCIDSWLKVLDLASQVIDMGYRERRLQRIKTVTRMSREMVLEMVEGNGADQPEKGFL